PPFVAQGSGSAQLSISTATTIAPGTYPLTITATSGAITRTASAALVVSGPPDFTISPAPTSKSVVAGGSASYSVGDRAERLHRRRLAVRGRPARVGGGYLHAGNDHHGRLIATSAQHLDVDDPR